MNNLQNYIANPQNLGSHDADSLELLRKKFPYFQAIHILIAKCHKNQNAFGFNKNLKLASLYAGNREVLFKFINSEPEKIDPNIEELSIEQSQLKAQIIEELNNSESNSELFIKIPTEHITPESFELINSSETKEAANTLNEIIEENILTSETEAEVSQNLVTANETEEIVEETTLIITEEIVEEKQEQAPELIIIDEIGEAEEQITISDTEDTDDEELDFYSWLDNFNNKDHNEIKYKESLEPISENLQYNKPNEIEENLHIKLPGNFEEENEDVEIIYNPAAWAEIAYDIQAFVKNSDSDEEKVTTTKSNSKVEIDNLLDRFIKENPSISRPKAEFYKPENMARKSEEFHGEVVSETLAQLFYKQGHLHTSLEMYEKLMLQNPDKKDIFAARIKSLKEELINKL